MVSHGWALAFVKYSDRYSADQERAKLAKRGHLVGIIRESLGLALRRSTKPL